MERTGFPRESTLGSVVLCGVGEDTYTDLTSRIQDESVLRLLEASRDARRRRELGSAVSKRAEEERRRFSDRRSIVLLAGAGGAGLLCGYQRYPLLGASIALAPLLYIGGAWMRYHFEIGQARRLEVEAARDLEGLLEQATELHVNQQDLGFHRGDLVERIYLPSSPEYPSIWKSCKPYVQGYLDLLAVVNFTSALLQFSGFRDVGFYLHLVQHVGVSLIVAGWAIRGMYDREASLGHRLLHSVVTAGLTAILGGVVYQAVTGHSFGEWQWIWLVVSQLEHLFVLGYQLIVTSAPIRNAMAAIKHHGMAQKADGSKMRLFRAEMIGESLAFVASVAALIQPCLHYAEILDRNARPSCAIRLTEGVTGILPVVWNRCGSQIYQKRDLKNA